MQARAALGRESGVPWSCRIEQRPGLRSSTTQNPESFPLLPGSAKLYHGFRKPGEAGQVPTNNSPQGNPPLLPTKKRPGAEAAFQGNRRAQRIISRQLQKRGICNHRPVSHHTGVTSLNAAAQPSRGGGEGENSKIKFKNPYLTSETNMGI